MNVVAIIMDEPLPETTKTDSTVNGHNLNDVPESTNYNVGDEDHVEQKDDNEDRSDVLVKPTFDIKLHGEIIKDKIFNKENLENPDTCTTSDSTIHNNSESLNINQSGNISNDLQGTHFDHFNVNDIGDDVDPGPSEDVLQEQRELKRKTFSTLVTINVIAFLASFFYWIQNGVFPYLTRSLGVSPEMFGYIESTFAFYQLIGSPIFGRCGDVFGTRIVMMISELASTISYITLAVASNIGMLFLSRVPALAMHNLQGSYMIISDITLPDDRANMLGKLGVSHGLGMVTGSFVGGIVTHIFSERAATVVSACGNIVCVVIIFVFIPKDTKSIRQKLDNLQQKLNRTSLEPPPFSMSSFSITQIFSILKIKIIQYLLFLKIMSAFPFSLIYSMFSIAIMDYFKLGPKYNGAILAYVGILGIFVQGVLIGLLTRKFKDPELIKYSMFLIAASCMFLIVADNIFFFCFLLFPLSIGAITSHIVLLAAITKVVPITDTGSALGLTLALHAVVRSIAPSLGGLLFTSIGWPIFGAVGYVMHLFLSGFVVLNGRKDY